MNYVYLTVIVMFLSMLHEYYKKDRILANIFLFLICLVLCVFAGLRNEYNDTVAYIGQLKYTITKSFSYVVPEGEFKVSNVYLFRLLNWFVYNYITRDFHIYLGICSAIFVVPAINLIRKYSRNFIFSILIFMMMELYMFSLAAIKQALAMGIMAIGIDAFINKRMIKYYIYCILAMGFHTYAGIYLLLPLLGRKPWNLGMKILCASFFLIGIFFSRFSGLVLNVSEFLGKDVLEENLLSGNMNIYRVFVYAVPFVLSVVSSYTGKKEVDEGQVVLMNIGIFSSLLTILGVLGSPILFGRLPNYYMLGTAICIPYLINKVFSVRSRPLITFIAVTCYCFFGIYSLYGDGGFERDIFQLKYFTVPY